jgi:hypothetical protein
MNHDDKAEQGRRRQQADTKSKEGGKPWRRTRRRDCSSAGRIRRRGWARTRGCRSPPAACRTWGSSSSSSCRSTTQATAGRGRISRSPAQRSTRRRNRRRGRSATPSCVVVARRFFLEIEDVPAKVSKWGMEVAMPRGVNL